MQQVNTDTQWLAVKNFAQQHIKPDERILAPASFKHQLPKFYAYKFTYEIPADQFQWVLIHKGMLNAIDTGFLKQTISLLRPVFANEVFVVFTSRLELPSLDQHSVHWRSFLQQIDPSTAGSNGANFGLKQTLLTPAKRVKDWFADPRLDGLSAQLSQVIKRLSDLEKTTKKLKQEMPSQQSRLPLVRSSAVLASMSLEELRSACRNACQTAYLGENLILCRILTNYLVYGDTRDIGIVPHLCLNGFWEPWVTLAVLRSLKPGWRCLDVGANHGYYSVVMSSVVGSSGRVVALEPNARLASMVSKTLEVNGFDDRATSIAKAVSDKDGEILKLVIPVGHTGHAALRETASPTDEVMEVETISIDSLTADWDRVDCIKIDVEGAEEAVWRGMKETVRRNPDIKLVLEFGPSRYPNPRAFLEEIVAEGFILRYIDYDTYPKEISIDRCIADRPDSHWDLFLSRQ
ncbi:MAG: hypothetical protein Kow00121_49350 [Elainellaceae cyanobacterium]